MQKAKEVLSKLWNGYRSWLGDVIWYKNWKVWLSVVIVLMLGALGDSDEPEVEAEANEPETEEVVEKKEPEVEEVEEEPEEIEEEPEEVVEDPEEEPEDEEPVILSPEFAVSFLNTQDISDITDVDFNEDFNAVTLMPHDDSIAQAFVLVSDGFLSDDYEYMLDGLSSLSEALFDMSEVGLILLNPQNTDNMLLWLEDGHIIYDATND